MLSIPKLYYPALVSLHHNLFLTYYIICLYIISILFCLPLLEYNLHEIGELYLMPKVPGTVGVQKICVE